MVWNDLGPAQNNFNMLPCCKLSFIAIFLKFILANSYYYYTDSPSNEYTKYFLFKRLKPGWINTINLFYGNEVTCMIWDSSLRSMESNMYFEVPF